MKKYDYTINMSQDIIDIDAATFKDISLTASELSLRIKKNPSYELFVHYVNNTPAGYLGLMYVTTPHYEGAWIDLLAVHPNFQNKGIGKYMIDQAKSYIKDEKSSIEFISALIRKHNLPSLNAAKSQGFRSDGNGDFELLFYDME